MFGRDVVGMVVVTVVVLVPVVAFPSKHLEARELSSNCGHSGNTSK